MLYVLFKTMLQLAFVNQVILETVCHAQTMFAQILLILVVLEQFAQTIMEMQYAHVQQEKLVTPKLDVVVKPIFALLMVILIFRLLMESNTVLCKLANMTQ
jgi:hypothetical protein